MTGRTDNPLPLPEWAAALCDLSSDGLLVLSAGRVIYCNRAAADLVGQSPDYLRGAAWQRIAESLAIDPDQFHDAVVGPPGTVCCECLDSNGEHLHALALSTQAWEVPGQHFVLAAFRAITTDDMVPGAVESNHQRRDPLTGLPDRNSCLARLEEWFALSAEARPQLVAMFIDLVEFKSVNDMHGHVTGDAVLQVVARRLQHCVESDDWLARYGGDEFLILVTGVDAAASAQRIAERIESSMSAPFDVQGTPFRLAATVGTATAGASHAGPLDLIRAADRAMYQQKRCDAVNSAKEA